MAVAFTCIADVAPNSAMCAAGNGAAPTVTVLTRTLLPSEGAPEKMHTGNRSKKSATEGSTKSAENTKVPSRPKSSTRPPPRTDPAAKSRSERNTRICRRHWISSASCKKMSSMKITSEQAMISNWQRKKPWPMQDRRTRLKWRPRCGWDRNQSLGGTGKKMTENLVKRARWKRLRAQKMASVARSYARPEPPYTSEKEIHTLKG